jgi:hypothetical protein
VHRHHAAPPRLAARLGDKPAKGEITVVIAGLERKKRVKGEEE